MAKRTKIYPPAHNNNYRKNMAQKKYYTRIQETSSKFKLNLPFSWCTPSIAATNLNIQITLKVRVKRSNSIFAKTGFP